VTPVTPPVVAPPPVDTGTDGGTPVVQPPVTPPVVAPADDMLHFHLQTAAHTIDGYAPGVTVSFDGYGAGATVTHEIGGAADEYRASGPNGYDTFVLPGETDLAALTCVFDGTGEATTPPVVSPPEVTPSVVTPPEITPPTITPPIVTPPVVVAPAETIHFANQTEAHTIDGYASGDVISFDGYGANASLTHEVDGTADEYRADGANGYDTFHLPGVTDLASIHYVFA
jgi:hypothetical protein